MVVGPDGGSGNGRKRIVQKERRLIMMKMIVVSHELSNSNDNEKKVFEPGGTLHRIQLSLLISSYYCL